MLEIFEKYFEINTVMRNGRLCYKIIYPNKDEGMKLFIYNPHNFNQKYIPLDDEHMRVFDYDALIDAYNNMPDFETTLLEMLGEEIKTYYALTFGTGKVTYMEYNPKTIEYFLRADVDTIKKVEMTEIQFKYHIGGETKYEEFKNISLN